MRNIGDVKNKKIKNVKYVRIIDNNTIHIELQSGYVITLKSSPTDYGYSSVMYIEE